MSLRIVAAAVAALLIPSAGALAESGATLAESLAGDSRTPQDRARDAGRKPAEVLAFLGVKPGDTVIDVIAAGGYYTEVLSHAVGEEGKVYAQNPPAVLRFREGANDKALTARLANERLPNVERVDVDLASVSVAPGSIDVAITALNFHDIYQRRGKDAAVAFLRIAHGQLKPGGVFGVIDHVGKAGADNASLHRIDPELVKAAIADSPFELEATSDLLRNEDDDHTKSVFDEGIRGKTDRFLFRLRKSK